MLTSTSSGAVSPLGRPNTYYSKQFRGSTAQTSAGHNYDSADFSSVPEGKSAFQMEMVSRLSQEVRTSTTTGSIRELRQAVASGAYTPDPMAIAGRILFLAEE